MEVRVKPVKKVENGIFGQDEVMVVPEIDSLDHYRVGLRENHVGIVEEVLLTQVIVR